MKRAKISSRISFNDDEEASVVLELTNDRLILTTTAKDVPNIEVWDRTKITRIQVFSARDGEWFPKLTLTSGQEVTLGIPLDEAGMRKLAAAF
jgi:hypothetical protein